MPKEPISPQLLGEMVQQAGLTPSLTTVRTLAACLLAFGGFLRSDELIKLRCCDVTFVAEGLILRICSSKTDQFREGDSVVIAKTGRATCPVGMLQKYCAMGRIDLRSRERLFRGITTSKHGEQLRKSGGLSYTRFREILLASIKDLGLDPSAFGMHSLRSGGATAAANAEINDRLFKRHGRWRSENAKDGYVKDSLERRLRVSKSLGL